jgi:hypothetical protein
MFIERRGINMKRPTKVKQIVVRFDQSSYDLISRHAEIEHRTLGEFVRHAALEYIDMFHKGKENLNKKGGRQT